MATVLEPGVAWAMFAKLGDAYKVTGRISITKVAEAVKSEAKRELRRAGSHKPYTKTPATPGGPPARISGTLSKSIDRSIIDRTPLGWACRIGTATGFYPPYDLTSKASSKYGLILETIGCKDGSFYPFLERAATYVFDIEAFTIYTSMYGQETKAWARIF